MQGHPLIFQDRDSSARIHFVRRQRRSADLALRSGMIISLSISIIVLAISIELRSRTARFLSNSGKWPAFLLVRSRTYSRGQGFERLVMAGGGGVRGGLFLLCRTTCPA